MAYSYEAEKPELFTDEGQRQFLKVRDEAQRLLKLAGAVTCDRLLLAAGSGSSWTQLACVDRLVELGEIRRITPVGSVATQNEVFVSARRE
ncbi:MAG TPA: hypothetical protein VI653_13335 [Steroidobacteraceae bacterium]